jgi:DNA mismatch repair ATPase MutS
LDTEHRKVGANLGQEVDKKLFMENHKTHGWCFRLTRAEAGSIRNQKSYREIATMKNGVYFTTNFLQDLNREFDKATQTYNKTQSGLVDEVVAVASEFLC